MLLLYIFTKLCKLLYRHIPDAYTSVSNLIYFAEVPSKLLGGAKVDVFWGLGSKLAPKTH